MTSYTQAFYDSQIEGSSKSAKIIIPLVLDLLKPESVVDVGCGAGTWLDVYKSNGVKDILGLDGDYVDQKVLKIKPTEFKATDLTGDFGVGRSFDLVQSLEVAEHLDQAFAEQFVAQLVSLGPVVLFSAAVPYQLGTHHVNEQFLPYWCDLFARHGYGLVDCFRSQVWSNTKVEVCYRQNIVLFVASERITSDQRLKLAYENTNEDMLSVIHPELYKPRVDRVLNNVFEAARQLHQLGQLQQAEALYLSILDFNPYAAGVWDARGQLAAQAGDLKIAIVSFKRAVESEPGVATYHFNLGQASLMNNDRVHAAVCFKKAIEIKADYIAARDALAALM